MKKSMKYWLILILIFVGLNGCSNKPTIPDKNPQEIVQMYEYLYKEPVEWSSYEITSLQMFTECAPGFACLNKLGLIQLRHDIDVLVGKQNQSGLIQIAQNKHDLLLHDFNDMVDIVIQKEIQLNEWKQNSQYWQSMYEWESLRSSINKWFDGLLLILSIGAGAAL